MNGAAVKENLEKVIVWLQREYAQLHTGRATPSLLDGIYIEAYGSKMPLLNLASVTTEDPKTLRIVPYDKGQIKDIEKAIVATDIGLSTSVDDHGLRVHVPQLTEETRQKLVKLLSEKLEDARVTVRNERKEAMDAIEKGDLSEDEREREKEKLQELIDQTNADLQALFKKKEADVLTI